MNNEEHCSSTQYVASFSILPHLVAYATSIVRAESGVILQIIVKRCCCAPVVGTGDDVAKNAQNSTVTPVITAGAIEAPIVVTGDKTAVSEGNHAAKRVIVAATVVTPVNFPIVSGVCNCPDTCSHCGPNKGCEVLVGSTSSAPASHT